MPAPESHGGGEESTRALLHRRPPIDRIPAPDRTLEMSLGFSSQGEGKGCNQMPDRDVEDGHKNDRW
ncbi:MAG: hypothetical protein DWQ40_11170 [Actinobacteria bacterium]|nr:MAG: hypothetical protein DWQ40_11170 [Actinomycetota bacterium]